MRGRLAVVRLGATRSRFCHGCRPWYTPRVPETPKSLAKGRYTVHALLGEGAQGATYEASDASARGDERVAIKCFRIRGAKSWKDVELAEREARVLASLRHPLIPRYIDHFEEDGALWLVTEKIDGESLGALRKQGVRFSEREVRQFLADVADALAYLHTRAPPVIHRDIKPSNVIRRTDGHFVLIDFGAVRDKMKPEGGSTVVGTFGYMAPEQFQGRAMPASDVYAVGATALQLITGIEPEEMPHKGLAIDVRAAMRGVASDDMTNVLCAMLEPDPDKRASSIGPLLTPGAAGSAMGAARPPVPGSFAAYVDARATGVRSDGGLAASALRDQMRRARSGVRDQLERVGAEVRDQLDRAAHDLENAFGPRAHADPGARPSRRERRENDRAARNEARAAEREARAVERAQRARIRREQNMQELGESLARTPPIGRVFATLGLVIAMLAVTTATQIVVPTVLRLLSILFGRPLRNAADDVQRAGRDALDGIRHAMRVMRGQPPAASVPTEVAHPTPSDVVASNVASNVRVAPGVRATPNAPPAEVVRADARPETQADADAAEWDAQFKARAAARREGKT